MHNLLCQRVAFLHIEALSLTRMVYAQQRLSSCLIYSDRLARTSVRPGGLDDVFKQWIFSMNLLLPCHPSYSY